jgi:hypothetical protein
MIGGQWAFNNHLNISTGLSEIGMTMVRAARWSELLQVFFPRRLPSVLICDATHTLVRRCNS